VHILFQLLLVMFLVVLLNLPIVRTVRLELSVSSELLVVEVIVGMVSRAMPDILNRLSLPNNIRM